MSAPTVYLIDASIYVFRAWHAVPPEFRDVDESPVNAVYGFSRFLCDFLERTRPTHVVVAFDESLTSSFRNGIYPEYKANRELPPAELLLQFDYCKRLTAAMGLAVLTDLQYEADDLIGSVTARARGQGFRAVIVSADKDFGQLVGDHVEQWDFSRDQRWDAAGVRERLGVHPDQVADFLALTGDAVDNIPGVHGVGAKTAATLLAHFGTLEALYARVEEVPYLRLRGAAQVYARLKEHRAQAQLSRALTGIVMDVPIRDTWALGRSPPDLAEIDQLVERLRFGPLTRTRLRTVAAA
jgi:DNA polymerase I